MEEENTKELAEYGKRALKINIDENLEEAESLFADYRKGLENPQLINISIRKVSKMNIFTKLDLAKIPYASLIKWHVDVKYYEQRIKSLDEKLK